MAKKNPTKKATFRALVNEVDTDIMIRTSADNVVVDKSSGKFLDEKLKEIDDRRTIIYATEEPLGFKAGETWVQPVKDASILDNI